ncbi:MAG: restriction endonuclease, partial [Acidobacteria bacterium]|nr:restriction endonuclease [Acidobacteriota bacterium]
MAIPNYQTVMLPLLKLVRDKKEYSLRELIDGLANEFKLSQEEKESLLVSGRKAIFYDRVGWAKTYLGQAKLLEFTRRGFFKISERGLKLINENPQTVNDKTLLQFPEFQEFIKRKSKKNEKTVLEIISEVEDTPDESLESAYQTIRNALAIEIIEKIKSCSPIFFERLVVELLVKMGYGGTLQEAGQAVGRSGDGGIDGIINEDRLGLDVIYLQ